MIINPRETIELPDEVSSILYNFPNQSLSNNFDPEKFPGIQKVKAIIIGKFMNVKVIPRAPFYYETSRRKPILQISEATVFNQKDTVLQKSSNIINLQYINEEEVKQEIFTNEDPEITKKHLEIILNGYRNFNQWSLAVNFDSYNYSKTYENTSIDEDTPMNYERDPCDINFRDLIDIWKSIENIQQYGKCSYQSNFTKSG
jgi:hypothetical protein